MAERIFDRFEHGSIVVYSGFESQRLSTLAAWLPENAERINAIKARLFDLLPIVREHTYHPAYAGSYSDQIGATRARATGDIGWHGSRTRRMPGLHRSAEHYCAGSPTFTAFSAASSIAFRAASFTVSFTASLTAASTVS